MPNYCSGKSKHSKKASVVFSGIFETTVSTLLSTYNTLFTSVLPHAEPSTARDKRQAVSKTRIIALVAFLAATSASAWVKNPDTAESFPSKNPQPDNADIGVSFSVYATDVAASSYTTFAFATLLMMQDTTSPLGQLGLGLSVMGLLGELERSSATALVTPSPTSRPTQYLPGKMRIYGSATNDRVESYFFNNTVTLGIGTKQEGTSSQDVLISTLADNRRWSLDFGGRESGLTLMPIEGSNDIAIGMCQYYSGDYNWLTMAKVSSDFQEIRVAKKISLSAGGISILGNFQSIPHSYGAGYVVGGYAWGIGPGGALPDWAWVALSSDFLPLKAFAYGTGNTEHIRNTIVRESQPLFAFIGNTKQSGSAGGSDSFVGEYFLSNYTRKQFLMVGGTGEDIGLHLVESGSELHVVGYTRSAELLSEFVGSLNDAFVYCQLGTQVTRAISIGSESSHELFRFVLLGEDGQYIYMQPVSLIMQA